MFKLERASTLAFVCVARTFYTRGVCRFFCPFQPLFVVCLCVYIVIVCRCVIFSCSERLWGRFGSIDVTVWEFSWSRYNPRGNSLPVFHVEISRDLFAGFTPLDNAVGSCWCASGLPARSGVRLLAARTRDVTSPEVPIRPSEGAWASHTRS